MNNKIFGQRMARDEWYKLSWQVDVMCLCGQVDKRVDNRSRGQVQVQVQVSRKESLEYTVN